MGIIYNRRVMYVGLGEARNSGIKEVFTKIGKPYSQYDACEWVELPENPIEAAAVFISTIGNMEFRRTCRVTTETNENAAQWIGANYELITC